MATSTVDPVPISFHALYEAHHKVLLEQAQKTKEEAIARSPFQKHLRKTTTLIAEKNTGFARIQLCRDALTAIDGRGWNRSFHQRLFHDQFIRACARIFFKTEPPGTFARAHQAILDINSWESLSQEVLISTPRRFGKTISVSMFAAAMIFACPSIEISIYSTCKRISQKLLRNVQKFLLIIYDSMKVSKMREMRANMEEVVLQGPDGMGDIRIVNSYPSKVCFSHCFYSILYRPLVRI